ncbi:MAG: ATP-binding protein [Candidatus Pacebacteria bacterium]|nr:ATP-binding protein [Candidatus Paceibacterota bacterium]
MTNRSVAIVSFTAKELEETKRLQALSKYCLLDSEPEEEFDRMTELAASIFDVPIASISMVDHKRQWLKSKIGMECTEIPLEVSFCAHAIRQNSILVVPNTQNDLRFAKNPMVLGPAGIKFYVGTPLITRDGYRIGTLCLADRKPRPDLTDKELKILQILSSQIMDQIELRSARLEAEKGLRDKTTFVAALSHEIRTPMSGIIGTAQLLLDNTTEPVKRRYIETLLGCTGQMQRLLDDILDLSKLEAGHMELVNAQFGLNSVVALVFELFQNTAKAKNLKLELVGAEAESYRLLLFYGDAQRLRQILINLINNAIKFTEQGFVRLSVAVTQNQTSDSGETAEVEFKIEDSGCGIPPEMLEQLGQDYFQVDAGQSRRVGGTGLGLSISRKILTRLGGSLSVTSTVGQGSCFSFNLTLPVVGKAGQQKDSQSLPASAQSEPSLNGANRSLDILCVDDDHAGLMVTSELLRRAGHRIVPAATALEAIERVVERQFDAILLDMNLPDLDGPALAQAIRSLETPDRRTPLIAVTASAFASDRQKCLDADMDEHITKPVNFKLLLDSLTRLSRGNKQIVINPTAAVASLPQEAEFDIDLSTLNELREIMEPRVMEEIMTLFSQNAEEIITLAAAHNQGRGESQPLVTKAHLLVGTAGSLGLHGLSQSARAVDEYYQLHHGLTPAVVAPLKLATEACLAKLRGVFIHG